MNINNMLRNARSIRDGFRLEHDDNNAAIMDEIINELQRLWHYEGVVEGALI